MAYIPSTTSSTIGSAYPTSTSQSDNLFVTSGPALSVLENNSWLGVVIVAAIGWINTWIIAACRVRGRDIGHVADRRYAGLAKRTIIPASLAHRDSIPSQIIGIAVLDPGLSTQLKEIDDPICHVGIFGLFLWGIQVLATLYAVVTTFIIWAASDTTVLAIGAPTDQIPAFLFQQQLGALNVNRGTWALAVIGCLIPCERRIFLYITTGIAVALDIICIVRAFLIAGQIQNAAINAPGIVLVLGWLFPSLEGFVFLMGVIAVFAKISYLKPTYFLPGALWLVFGPFAIIIFAILSHFAQIGF